MAISNSQTLPQNALTTNALTPNLLTTRDTVSQRVRTWGVCDVCGFVDEIADSAVEPFLRQPLCCICEADLETRAALLPPEDATVDCHGVWHPASCF